MENLENMGNSIEELLKAISQSLKELSTCKDIEQKKTHAEIVKLLCDSLGVFFDAMNMGDISMFDDLEDDDDDYDDDDVVDFSSIKRKKNKKKKKDDDIPF